MHEMMHALGYWHEHSRPDRDDFVTIRKECIIPRKIKNWIRKIMIANTNYYIGYLHNFDKEESSLTFNLPYDQNSVMHYHSTAASIDGVQETIVAKVLYFSEFSFHETLKLYRMENLLATLAS